MARRLGLGLGRGLGMGRMLGLRLGLRFWLGMGPFLGLAAVLVQPLVELRLFSTGLHLSVLAPMRDCHSE
jgi:hypothetical protein